MKRKYDKALGDESFVVHEVWPKDKPVNLSPEHWNPMLEMVKEAIRRQREKPEGGQG